MEAAIQYYQNKLVFEMNSSDLFDVLEAKQNVVVIDARKHFAFVKGYIPGAIILPHRTMNAETAVGFDKDVIYESFDL